MTKLSMRGIYLATAAIAVAQLASPAFAQNAATPAAAPSADQDNEGVDEIVVTAQRQSQKILDVPLSLSAISGDKLAASGIKQISDLVFTTPGFVPSNSNGYNQMFIRGIGNSIFVGADPSVATFIDDVPRVFGTTVNNLVDVERVEVIKGAPGALYGRNATGGAVNIITRQPSTNAFSGKFRVSYGTKQTFQASGFLNVPLSDNAAWTISAERRSHDPYIKNLTTSTNPYTAANFPGGSPLVLHMNAQQTADFFNSANVPKKGYANEDFWAVGSKLMVQPSSNFKFTLAADYSKKDDSSGNGVTNITPLALQGFTDLGTLGFFLSSYAGTTPNLPPNFLNNPTTKFTTAQRGDSFARLEDYGGSGTAVLNLDGADLTSITSWRKANSDFLSDFSFSGIRTYESRVTIRKTTFYQELRAVSTGDSPFHYVAGASYLHAKFDGGLAANIIPPVIVGVKTGQVVYVVKNWSAFAQLSYDLTENLNFMASGRYIHETNDSSFTAPVVAQFHLKESKFLPGATLSYRLDGGGNIYARWARGFKAGGVNPIAPPSNFPSPTTQGGIFKGEVVDSFEVGVRAPLADRKVQLTAAIFYNDYSNVQVSAHAKPAFSAAVPLAIVNAATARTYGAELSIVARVAKALTLNAAVGYLNAKFRKFEIVNNPVLEDAHFSGTRMTNSPEWQLSFGADLDQPLNDQFRLVGNVMASHTGATIWQQTAIPGLLPNAVGPSYWLVNARLGIRTTDDKWEVAAYAKNLFNAAYSTYGGSSSFGTILGWGDPRIIGVEATMKF